MCSLIRKLIPVSIIIFLSTALAAQEFGGNPPYTRWKQIDTDTARIIFPAGTDSQANRVASIIHYLAKEKPVSLGNRIQKISIVLQNQTTIANGYVQLGPFRSEFFLTPPMNNFEEGGIGWADQLSVHEYRHVQQFNNFNNGLSSVMKVLFGQDGYALAINASVPDWFYEGDAVYNETILTNQGRGRLPLFLNAFPSLWQAGKKYSWMKLRNGSFKDYVPGHYPLGYLLVNYGREKYGEEFWTKVTTDATAFKSLFYPFQKAVERYSGVDFKKFREEAFNFYKEKVARVSATRDEFIFSVNKEQVVNYYFPYQVGEDALVYLKTSLRQRPAFYIKDKQGEHKIKVRDISQDQQFSCRNGKIVYAAFENDSRWGWQNYGVIKLLDIRSRIQQTLTHKTKYFTPDITEDGKKIAAVNAATSGKSEIHILDANTGNVLQTYQSPEVNLFTDPKFISNDSLVTPVRVQDGQMTMMLLNLTSGGFERLIPQSFNVIGYPCFDNGFVFFTASYAGNDDIFTLHLADRKIYRITDGPLGNYYVNASGNKITWSVFTAEGYQLKQVNRSDIRLDASRIINPGPPKEKFSVNSSNEYGDILSGKVSFKNFPSTRYKKSTRLFNFHSWRPYYEDPVFTFSLYGENILNTMQTEAYYLYNQNERTNAVGINAIYGNLFPYLNIGTEYTFNRKAGMGNKLRQWNQLDSKIGFSIPLNYTSGTTYKSFNLSGFYVLRNEFNRDFFKDSLGNTSFSYLSHSISWTQQIQNAVQHIYPRLAYSLFSGIRHPISRYSGYQFYGSAAFYLPGILSTHSLVLNGAFQQRDTSRLIFSTRIANARGYADYYGTNAGSRIWRLSANYHLPLFYPDWGFGNILYLQRFRTNIFYDWQRVFSNNKTFSIDLKSAGIEFYMDTKWWNQYPLTFGFRISHILDNDPRSGNRKGSDFYEFILPVSIIPK
jgi:hypothetical protein